MKASNIKIKTIDLASSRKEQMSFPQINFVEMAKEPFKKTRAQKFKRAQAKKKENQMN